MALAARRPRGDALRRLNQPGRFRDQDVTIQDVFEAIGATRPATSPTRSFTSSRLRLSGRRGVRGPVHGQDDGLRVRGDGHLPDGRVMVPAVLGQKARWPAGRAPHSPGPRQRPPPKQMITRESLAPRSPRLRFGRLHERRAAPAWPWPAKPGSSRDRRLRSRLAPDPATRGHEARWGGTSRRPVPGGRGGPDPQRLIEGALLPSRVADRTGPHLGEEASTFEEPRVRWSSAPSRNRSNPRAA